MIVRRTASAVVITATVLVLGACGDGPPVFAEDDLFLQATKDCGEGPPSACFEGFTWGTAEAENAWQTSGQKPISSAMRPVMQEADQARNEATWQELFPNREDYRFAQGYLAGWFWVVSGAD